MDPKLLFHLCEVIDQGSMSRAALSLDVTQPTLSRNIKQIEEIVGEPVLHRDRYGVSPTHLGEKLARHGRQILNAMASADATVHDWQTGMVGELHIGIESMLSTAVLADLLAGHPGTHCNRIIRFLSTDEHTLAQQLRKGDVDVAIMPAIKNWSTNAVNQTPLFNEKLCVLAGSKSPLANFQGVVSKQQLRTQPWACINRVANSQHRQDEIAQFLGIDGVVPKFEFDGDVHSAIEIVRNSDFLTLTNLVLAEKVALDGGLQILHIDIDTAKRPFALYMRKDISPDVDTDRLEKRFVAFFGSETFVSRKSRAPANTQQKNPDEFLSGAKKTELGEAD